MILLRINWPNFVQFSIQLDVLGSGLSWYVVKCRLYSVINIISISCDTDRLLPSLFSVQLWNIVLWTGRLQLHKSRFTTAQFDFTTAHLLINCTIKYALWSCMSGRVGSWFFGSQSESERFRYVGITLAEIYENTMTLRNSALPYDQRRRRWSKSRPI